MLPQKLAPLSPREKRILMAIEAYCVGFILLLPAAFGYYQVMLETAASAAVITLAAYLAARWRRRPRSIGFMHAVGLLLLALFRIAPAAALNWLCGCSAWLWVQRYFDSWRART